MQVGFRALYCTSRQVASAPPRRPSPLPGPSGGCFAACKIGSGRQAMRLYRIVCIKPRAQIDIRVASASSTIPSGGQRPGTP